MARFLLFFALLVAWVYTTIVLIRTPKSELRTLPKAMWIILVLLLVGVPAYWLFGHPRGMRRGDEGGRGARRLPKAPDDDPEFLRRLDEAAWRDKMERRRNKRGDGDANGEVKPA